MYKADIITIGDEILIGQVIDTNSAWMSAELNKLGIGVSRIISIQDNEDEILRAVDNSFNNADVILITGGLGPTSDDITKPALAKYFNTRLVFNADVFLEVSNRLSIRGLPMNEKNRHQADVPESCTVLMNKAGTAPGMLFRKDGKVIISMPGVPSEMKYLMNEHVLPLLSGSFKSGFIIHKNIMTYGIGESLLAERLENFEKELPNEIRLAYLPSFGIVKLRLTARGDDEAKLKGLIDQQVRKLYSIVAEAIYGEDEVTLEEAVGNLLLERNLTLSTAESCTGGKIASMITSIPGCSAWYNGSVVTYGNAIKIEVLGCNPETMERYGAVSEEIAREMAIGAKEVFGTSFSIGISGIAGPSGGSEEKPVGTVCIAVASPHGVVSERFRFGDNRIINISRFATTALNMVRKQIINM